MQTATPRADRLIVAIPDATKAQNGKDTRRWCRGHFGIEHQPVWQHWFEICRGEKGTPMDYQLNRCLKCGRSLGLRIVPSNAPSHRPTSVPTSEPKESR